ncbi:MULTISPECIES: hypothetical protein [unclassified Pseudomonas]|jgi:hypothetical protein|uniref:hypothetical protein n=1 Tax=unclassified Pseudomonas TaxID=196821 RepID=UPI0019136D0B|nr:MULTISPECIES: hypothetical protein [unclassified Pseudomonas]MBK5554157.1 hypothetical protein [Pseudomonas sp. TH03]MEB0223692.1 hypothetical protein [Pseudomonas sp. 5S1]MEB0297281.1 hypothetical protein [Pseudomonas sp. 10S4]WPX17566.1 hypothetical protein RHM58_27530 [Pseudomonas sp. 10S4]
MQMTTALLIVNPCDDEEDNMAMLCCHSDQGDMFLMTRYPDEDALDITLDGEPSTLDGVKVTLSPTRLLIEIAAGDADALNGDDSLEIIHNTDASDLAEVEETLQNILKGTGTYISEL